MAQLIYIYINILISHFSFSIPRWINKLFQEIYVKMLKLSYEILYPKVICFQSKALLGVTCLLHLQFLVQEA
jgi:hypothetical protein